MKRAKGKSPTKPSKPARQTLPSRVELAQAINGLAGHVREMGEDLDVVLARLQFAVWRQHWLTTWGLIGWFHALDNVGKRPTRTRKGSPAVSAQKFIVPFQERAGDNIIWTAISSDYAILGKAIKDSRATLKDAELMGDYFSNPPSWMKDKPTLPQIARRFSHWLGKARDWDKEGRKGEQLQMEVLYDGRHES